MVTQLTQSRPQAASVASAVPASFDLLQRKCACGSTPDIGGEYAECHKKRLALQRASLSLVGRRAEGEGHIAPPIVHDVLRSPGQPLDPRTRAFMEPRLGHALSRVSIRPSSAENIQSKLTVNSPDDQFEQEANQVAEQAIHAPTLGASSAEEAKPGHNFRQVRIHTDARAAESARAVNALAYTVGKDIVFGAGQYKPKTGEGSQLLAHELTHVLQQSDAGRELQRQEKAKKPSPAKKKQPGASKPASKKSPVENISCERSVYVFVDAPVPYPTSSNPDRPPVGPKTRAPLPSSTCGGAGKTTYQHFNPNIRYLKLSNGDQYWWEDVPQKDGAWQRHYTVRKASESYCRFTFKPTTPCPSEVASKAVGEELARPVSESERLYGALIRTGWQDSGGSIREFEDGTIETEDVFGKIWTFIPSGDGTYFGFNNMDDTVIESTTLDESIWDSYQSE